MSTEIAKIKSLNGSSKDVYLTQFFGGRRRGLCLQISPSYGESYISMNKKQVQELVKELQNWLGENELPFAGLTPKEIDKAHGITIQTNKPWWSKCYISDDY